jgi:hypothetical protein
MESDLPHGFQLCPPDMETLANPCDLGKKLPDCNETAMPPTREDLEGEAEERRETCQRAILPAKPAAGDLQKPCDPPPKPIGARFDANRGVQQGAR